MTTWADLISLIMRDCGVLGVGQTLQSQDTTDAVRRINMMLAQWKRRRWLVYHLIDLTTPMTGAEYYTIGSGATINYARPDKIEAAFCRQVTQAQPNRVDFPMTIIQSYEEYSRISLKRLASGPSWGLFYDSGYPTGKLYPYPLASSQYELHVLVKAELDSITAVADTIILPPEYEQAIYACQKMATRSAYRLPVDLAINAEAKAALETLRSSNFQISTLQMPGTVRGRGGYNIFSDTWGPWGQ